MRQVRVPKKIGEFVPWFTSRGPKWKLRAVQIGLSTVQGTLADDTAKALQGRYDARVQAEEDVRNAVAKLADIDADAHRIVGDLMRLIDGFASNAADPIAVYALAEVPAPADPTPVGDPGLPSDFKVSLDQSGALNLSWKCANPPGSSGVVYEVKRGFAPEGPFGYLGVTSTRKFVDDTVPSGSSVVVYQITAIRSTSRGPVAKFNVQFGTGGGGLSITSVTQSGPAKLAA